MIPKSQEKSRLYLYLTCFIYNSSSKNVIKFSIHFTTLHLIFSPHRLRIRFLVHTCMKFITILTAFATISATNESVESNQFLYLK